MTPPPPGRVPSINERHHCRKRMPTPQEATSVMETTPSSSLALSTLSVPAARTTITPTHRVQGAADSTMSRPRAAMSLFRTPSSITQQQLSGREDSVDGFLAPDLARRSSQIDTDDARYSSFTFFDCRDWVKCQGTCRDWVKY